jgi:hypothetical protein
MTTPTEIAFLDLSAGTERCGQYWSDAPLVTGSHAVWVVATDTGRPVHVHRPHARHRDTRRALNGRSMPAYVTGVHVNHGTAYAGARYDLGER